MTPRAAANRSPPKRPAAKQSMRFSLRSLFLVSVMFALPLLLLANLRGDRRLEDSLGSPVYIFAGIAAVVASSAIGSALGHKVGTIATAVAAGIAWIALVVLLSDFSNALARLAPGHVAVAVLTVAAIAIAVYRQRDPPDLIPADYYSRLLDVRDQARQKKRPSESGDGATPSPAADETPGTDDAERHTTS